MISGFCLSRRSGHGILLFQNTVYYAFFLTTQTFDEKLETSENKLISNSTYYDNVWYCSCIFQVDLSKLRVHYMLDDGGSYIISRVDPQIKEAIVKVSDGNWHNTCITEIYMHKYMRMSVHASAGSGNEHNQPNSWKYPCQSLTWYSQGYMTFIPIL